MHGLIVLKKAPIIGAFFLFLKLVVSDEG